MDSQQIKQYFKSENQFGGVFPRDKLPYMLQDIPSGFIINTDSSEENGEHWVAIFVSTDKKGEYFDSFGLPPLHKDIIRYLNHACANGWVYNSCCVQDIRSKACGLFCIAFLKSRFRKISFFEFISNFSVIPSVNDRLLKSLI